MRKIFLIAFLAVAVFASGALAQTSDGAFAKLPRGEQKIVQALFEAQTTGTGGTTSTPLTRDQIAAKKAEGGWGQVFKDMKAAGLMGDKKNLGQVVSAYEKRHPDTVSTAKTDKTKPDKPEKAEKPDKPEKPAKVEKPEKPQRGGY